MSVCPTLGFLAADYSALPISPVQAKVLTLSPLEVWRCVARLRILQTQTYHACYNPKRKSEHFSHSWVDAQELDPQDSAALTAQGCRQEVLLGTSHFRQCTVDK